MLTFAAIIRAIALAGAVTYVLAASHLASLLATIPLQAIAGAIATHSLVH